MTYDMETFEDEVRQMLRRRAADVDGLADHEPGAGSPVRLPNPSPAGRSHRVLLSAAAVVAAVAVIGLGLVLRRDDASLEIDSVAPASAPQELPTWFDPATATVVYGTGYDQPREAAEDYMQARFPDFPAPDVGITDISVEDGLARARWAGRQPEHPYRGEVVLRLVDGSWNVVASTTEGVHLSGLERKEGVLEGEVTSAGIDMLALDVLGLDGEPVEDAPAPDGYPGASYRFGTAGVSGSGPGSPVEITASVEVGDEPVIVRAQHVGGTLLSVAEVAFPDPGSEPTPEPPPSTTIPATTIPAATIPAATIPAATMEDFAAVQTAVTARHPQYAATLEVNRLGSYTEFAFGTGEETMAFSLQVFDSGAFRSEEMEPLTELDTRSEDQAWLGADDPDLRSVYYLSAGGVGLRVASVGAGTPESLSVGDLLDTAAALTSDPAVADLAMNGGR